MSAHWKEPTVQTTPEYYQVLDLVHNLFATLSVTACNIPQSSLLPTMITVPVTKPSFLILPTIQDATLTINLNFTIQKWFSTCRYTLTHRCELPGNYPVFTVVMVIYTFVRRISIITLPSDFF